MDRYRVIKLIGDGTFGSVVQAEHVDDNRLVAIKRMKRTFDSWEECLSLREVKALKYLAHPNLVRLHEVVREHRVLHFVFEHLEMNLYQAVRHRHVQTVGEVRSILRQLLDGLIYMHGRGFAHRDIKPENILMSKRSGGGAGWLVKLADFGLAREIPDPDAPRGKDKLTEYVSTRWYRAPEVLLRCKDYDRQVDLWGLGTVVAEICTTRPLFPGRSEHDQLHRICLVLGCPNSPDAPGGYWAKGSSKAKSLGLIFQPVGS
ncbi:kinase-like domain-containing protein [Piptocephalis cylindrospora]|uniref:Kinase-like domain-containing protein n=1 Tax=Piptocephalis cylindrospora TaxID=1907219 RepID=A0A4P9XZS1_9FUNG|nr:kinase-like domain-containing protein [Piptocephalis cylindrospora]|eukprot:RKP11652.1 kinase-like domain-containing protein [Piptocephalis cylindrospora]